MLGYEWRCWHFLEIIVNSWKLLEFVGNCWTLLEIPGNCCELMGMAVGYSKLLVTAHQIWSLLLITPDSWIFLYISLTVSCTNDGDDTADVADNATVLDEDGTVVTTVVYCCSRCCNTERIFTKRHTDIFSNVKLLSNCCYLQRSAGIWA